LTGCCGEFSQSTTVVIAGLVPAIHDLEWCTANRCACRIVPAPCVFLDGRHEAGHDDLFFVVED
jgi:hypothetical protein